MKAFHDAGVRTTCFISPIFPGIYRRTRYYPAGQSTVQLDLAGKPEPARRLQKDNLRLYCRKSAQTLCRSIGRSISRKTAVIGMCWTRRCGNLPQSKACSMCVTTTPSAGRSMRRRLWSITFFTSRSCRRPRKSEQRVSFRSEGQETEQQTFFSQQNAAPLAARLRPQTLDEFVGQTHLLGEGKDPAPP